MLNCLQIENVAVIEKASLNFKSGFNVLTGETGAGKSIVIDAIHAVTGGKVSRDLVRTGASFALITAEFESNLSSELYDEVGIEPSDDGLIILSRRISDDGKSISRINGCPVSVNQLRTVGNVLLDIHGQNDGRKLLDESYHLTYLDGFAAVCEELSDYKNAYNELRELQTKWKQLSMDEGEKARKIDLLQYKISEIENAAIIPGELDEKIHRLELARNASKLLDALQDTENALSGQNGMDGAVSLTEEAEGHAMYAARFADDFDQIASRLRDCRYNLQDILEELGNLRRGLDFSPGELDSLESRVSLLKRLLKKYGPSEEKVLEELADAKMELEEIEFSEESMLKLESQIKKQSELVLERAEKLSRIRTKAAKELEKRILSELADLNMKGVSFVVSFEKCEPNAMGTDVVRFLMSANRGETPGRISRIASGGELSRIMLAMKNVLAEHDDVGTMIFDEIDTGVSGIAAQRVGEKMWILSTKRQVICVTHLPQIAVMADNHFSVEKVVSGDRTYTGVKRLGREERLEELSRLTSGEVISEITLAGSEELLRSAEKYKEYHFKN